MRLKKRVRGALAAANQGPYEKGDGVGRSLFVYGNIKIRKTPAYVFEKAIGKSVGITKKNFAKIGRAHV